MIVEDKRDRFPEGMRVLAVDDDPTCLKFLEALLRKCNYHVTVTNQAIKALEMLRENRNKYDLVISDVNMPDMDGFKLLELLGLEMDLPVIMLSGYSDVQLVMKGIDHGACDYMLKPVRLEELKNIWQHVVRKKKSSNQDKASNGTVEGGNRTSATGCSDQNVSLHKKRKDQDRDEEEEEYSEDDDETEDSLSQKKPRVIWNGDLHRKFLAAVSQLKEEDVVPKKILDLMEVKEITRENVASHLQKYRQGLRKMKNVMVASFGGNDSSYLQSLRSERMPSSTLSTYTSGGMFRGLNSPSGLSTVGMTSSSLGQPGYSQILSSYNNRFAKLQPTVSPNQGAHLFQVTPALSKLNPLEQRKCISHSGKSYPTADLAKYKLLTMFQDSGVSCSSLPSGSKFPSNPLLLGITQKTNSMRGFGDPNSVKVSSGIGISGSPNILDYNRSSENVQGGAQLSSFPLSASSTSHGQMNTSNMAACFNMPQTGNTLNEFSSVIALSASVGESRENVQNQQGLIGEVVPTLNYMPKKTWEEHKPAGYNHELNQTFSAITSQGFTSGIDGLVSPRVDQHDALCNCEKSPSLDEQSNGASAILVQPSEASRFSVEKQMKSNEDYYLEQTNSPIVFLDDSHETFEDIMNTITEREQNENVNSLLDAEFGFDAPHSLGSYM